MAASPSIAATRSVAPAQASARIPAKSGLFATMLRLWLDHNRRVAEFGMPPL